MKGILFRGKDVDNGTWLEGQYIHLHKTTYCFEGSAKRDAENEIHQIVFEVMTDWNLPNRHLRADVIPKTVGQYIGVRDCKRTKEHPKGQMIFEGDIGRYKQTGGARKNGKPIICTGKVVYNAKTASFAVDSIDEIGAKNYDYFPIKDFEVIGNIHDSPELLKGGEE